MITIRSIAVVSAWLTTACAIPLINRPIESQAEEWKLVVVNVRKGPHRSRISNGYIEPESGARFLWFEVRLKNQSSVSRWFNYDRCDLDGGAEQILPSIVRFDRETDIEAPEFEALAPGQEITRTLIFTYPDDRLPTRLQCGKLLIPLKIAKPPRNWR